MTVEQWQSLFLDFNIYLNVFVILAIVVFIGVSWHTICFFFLSFIKQKKFPKGKINYKYAILVPARNEDKVISNLLNSLAKQEYPKEFFDVYVIVESKDDPTIKIAESFNYNIVIRKDLKSKRTKGFALDEAYQSIKNSGKHYDAFMIFDADNVVASDFISLMNDVKNQGYKVGVGYRNFTNATFNWVSSCSAVLFSFMNNFTSYGRSRLFKKATLTGTGYFVDSDIVDAEGGWIWDGMTEDVQLTVYCYYHNVPMLYYKHAQYFDEQATQYSVIHKQHVRWVWGYFSDKRRYTSKVPNYESLKAIRRGTCLFEYNVSIYPFITYTILLIVAWLISFFPFIGSIVIWCTNPYVVPASLIATCFGFNVLFFVYLYASYMLAAVIVFIIDNKNLKFNFGKIFVSVISYMFFFADFLFAFFDGLFHKNKRTSWDKIIHQGEILNEGAKETLGNEKVKKG